MLDDARGLLDVRQGCSYSAESKAQKLTHPMHLKDLVLSCGVGKLGADQLYFGRVQEVPSLKKHVLHLEALRWCFDGGDAIFALGFAIERIASMNGEFKKLAR